MRGSSLQVIIVAASLLAAGGCASVDLDPEPVFSEVRAEIAERSGHLVHWRTGAEEDRAVAARLNDMLDEELTAEEAVQIALLSNHRLQAAYEQLGIAQADLVQAGLLRNPVFDASLRFVEGPGSDYIFEMGVVQDFLDVLQVPLRKRLALAELRTVQEEVTAQVLETVMDVQTAFYKLQAAQQSLDFFEQTLLAADASYDAAMRLHEAGNITDLSLANERALYEQAKLGLATAETAVLEAREHLNSLLGLWGGQANWRVAEALPVLPSEEPALADLESRVIAKNLDLAMIRRRMQMVAARTNIDMSELMFPELAAGAEAEREPDGTWSMGPLAAIGIPIFDIGAARKARGAARLRQLWEEYTAAAIDLRAATRAARYRLLNARRQARYYQRIMVPLAEQITAETQLQFNAMQLGVFQLLQAKQSEIEIRQQAIGALRDYWIARAEMDFLLRGGTVEQSAVSADTAGAMGPGMGTGEEGGH
jgi:cobalt-zinc-cadmium efflux system outer membrane protein